MSNQYTCGPLEKRFWSRVTRTDGCWLWTGRIQPESGYGRLGLGGRVVRAHRVAWELTNGPIPENMLVLHTCDNPACCNPAHLFLGTHKDNMQDMVTKGRNRPGRCYGVKNPQAKLTVAQVGQIRQSSLNCAQLSRQYGVTAGTIWYIKKNLTWSALR